jgi:aquaporin Z
MLHSLKTHWPEYLMEAAELGLFMISACFVTALLEHPASPGRQAIPNAILRRILTGMAMGLTAIAIIYSPWGKQSGAHFNPSVTWTFFRLGKVKLWDGVFYSVFQFVGGVTGVVVSAVLLGDVLSHQSVSYAVTLPGPNGRTIAFIAELVISFGMMSMILRVSNHDRLARYTGIFAGLLVATYISVEAPLSGMSMNPARTLGSAFPARIWNSLWIYFTAPPLGMLMAAEVHLLSRRRLNCAKLHHQNTKRCIFCGAGTGTAKAPS